MDTSFSVLLTLCIVAIVAWAFSTLNHPQEDFYEPDSDDDDLDDEDDDLDEEDDDYEFDEDWETDEDQR